jgi:hypothetical protein
MHIAQSRQNNIFLMMAAEKKEIGGYPYYLLISVAIFIIDVKIICFV